MYSAICEYWLQACMSCVKSRYNNIVDLCLCIIYRSCHLTMGSIIMLQYIWLSDHTLQVVLIVNMYSTKARYTHYMYSMEARYTHWCLNTKSYLQDYTSVECIRLPAIFSWVAQMTILFSQSPALLKCCLLCVT